MSEEYRALVRKFLSRRAPLAVYRRLHRDPFEPRYVTVFSFSVMDATQAYPVACILVSMSNGGGKCTCRFKTLEQVQQIFVIEPSVLPRLQRAVEEAQRHEAEFKTEMERLDGMAAIAEAERIVKGE